MYAASNGSLHAVNGIISLLWYNGAISHSDWGYDVGRYGQMMEI
jgi:hypothetical protein